MEIIQPFEAQRPYPAPPRRRMTVFGRFKLLCWGLFLLCVVMAYACGSQYPDTAPGPNIIWLYLAAWPGGVALLTALASWVATGRP